MHREHSARCRSCDIAGVRRPGWLNQQQVNFLFGKGLVLNAARDDEELTRFKDNLTIAQPDHQPPFEHQEEIVGVSSMNEPLLQATLSYEA